MVELRAMVEPQQGASYDQLLAVARAAEAAGYGAFFRSDHFLTTSGDGLPGPSDSWVTLGGLARDTDRIRLGTMVTAATFRLPGPLAIAVANVDEMSGGRVELGIGAAWFEAEHTAYGIPFPPVGERFERLEEQLAIITGLWECEPGATFSYNGKHYELIGSPALPKPVQRPRPPVIVGGGGSRITPRLAARFADEFNAPFMDPERAARQFERVRDACREAGRDPQSLRLSAAVTICCGTTEDEARRRAEAIGRDPAKLAANGGFGTPDQVASGLSHLVDAGATRLYVQLLDLDDLEHIALIGAEVGPLLG